VGATSLPLQETIARLAAALAIGLCIGLQRAMVGKDAGMRTHALVALGAAVMTLVSAYAFPDPHGRVDPTRIAAQIVTGIGFIGGGTIIKDGNAVRGLTTAASLWVAAGLGMAVGAGLYAIGALATIAVLLTLSLLTRLERRVRLPLPNVWQVQISLAEPAALNGILTYARQDYAVADLTAYAQDADGVLATLVVHASRGFDVTTPTARLRALGAGAVRWSVQSHGDLYP